MGGMGDVPGTEGFLLVCSMKPVRAFLQALLAVGLLLSCMSLA